MQFAEGIKRGLPHVERLKTDQIYDTGIKLLKLGIQVNYTSNIQSNYIVDCNPPIKVFRNLAKR